MKNRLCRLLAFLLIALLLTAAGCSANTEQISSTAAKAQTNDYSRGSAEKAAPQAPEYLDSSSPQQDVAAGRKLIKNVSLTVESLEYDKSLAAIKTRCDTFGGYIQSENSRGVSLNSSGTRSTTIVLRIPADKLDEFLTAADSFGNVTSNVSDTQDVTDSYYDIEANLESLILIE